MHQGRRPRVDPAFCFFGVADTCAVSGGSGKVSDMRLLSLLVVLVFVALGVLLGALNADLVSYDLGFARLGLPKGGALLAALLVGWLLGGLTAWWGVHRRHSARRRQSRPASEARSVP
jgi:uncharacterized integral membrane protein